MKTIKYPGPAMRLKIANEVVRLTRDVQAADLADLVVTFRARAQDENLHEADQVYYGALAGALARVVGQPI